MAIERLDLERDVVANRSSSDAPPRRPPVPNREGSYTVKLELLFAKIGGIEPHTLVRALLPSLRAATSRRLSIISRGGIGGSLGDAIQTVLPHDGASDFGAS